MINTYIFSTAVILFVLLFVIYASTKNKVKNLNNVKGKEEREKRKQLSKALRIIKWGWIVSIGPVLISGSIFFLGNGSNGQSAVSMEHIHGLGYSNDGKRILVPAHNGIKTYSDGSWGISEGEKHDYMGFSTVDDGFYSSGHPAPGSDKKNPFGIVKSTDEGKTLQTLDLYGQIDFHTMAAGFKSHAIYVINPEPNPRMSSAGLYYSKDETKTWTKSEMKGINEEVTALAVHPTAEDVIAIGTQNGVYLSKDFGQNFAKVLTNGQVTSLFFNAKGALFIGGYQQEPYLLKMDIGTKKSQEVRLPSMKQDAVAYFAQNPMDENKMAFASFSNNVYYSNDQGVNWTIIAEQGKVISNQKNTSQ